MDRIIGSGETLMGQAGCTANTYLVAAIKDIDERMGKGYAKKNPSLIAAFMRVCAEDFNTAVTASVIQDFDEHVCTAVERAGHERGDR